MKNIFIQTIRFFSLLFFLCLANIAGAQDIITPENPFTPGTDAGAVFNWFTAVYGAVITVATYIQGAFFKNTSWGRLNITVKYLVIAAATGALFLGLGWANALQVFIGFIGAAVTYDKALKPLGLTTRK